MSLIPPDFERCQAEIRKYNPWVMGGPVLTYERCPERPAILLRERVPGDDGQHGSMTVCIYCFHQFTKVEYEATVRVSIIEGG